MKPPRKRRQDPNVWLETHVEALKKYWAEGLTASQTAGQLDADFPGCGYTRSAVIGKVYRLGLSGRTTPKSSSPRPPRSPSPRRHHPFSQRKSTLLLKAQEAEPQADVVPEVQQDNVFSFPEGKSLLDLTEDDCHWPIGDPRELSFRFCGGASLQGFPYCLPHARMAYRPATDRRTQVGRRK